MKARGGRPPKYGTAMRHTVVAVLPPSQHILLEYGSDATGLTKAELVRTLIDRHLSELIDEKLERKV